jgi:hypothetical protein
VVFKLKYNLLAVSQVMLGAINIFILYRTYGAEANSAAFLLSLSIISSIQLILVSFSEQFVFHFHKARAEAESAGRHYYSSVFFSFLVLSLALGGVIFSQLGIILKLSAASLDPAAAERTLRLLEVLALSLLFYLPAQVTQAVLSARGQISTSYLLSSIPSFCQFAALVAAGMFDASIQFVAIAWTVGQFLSLVAGCIFAAPRLPTPSTFRHRLVVDTIVTSLKVRSAHNIHNFLLLLVINNYTSTLPLNYSALFFYVKRVSETFLNVVYGPTQKMLVNVISIGTQSGDNSKIANALRKTDLVFPPLFGIAIIFGFFAIPYLILLKPLTSEEIMFVQISFVLLMLHTFLMAVEMPYAIVSMARHASIIFYISNTIFIALLCGATFVLMRYSPNYALAGSMCIAQVGNFVIIRSSAKKFIVNNRG